MIDVDIRKISNNEKDSAAIEAQESLDLEQAADALLEAAGVLGRQKGVYTQSQLDRKARRENACLPVKDEHAVPEQVLDYLFERHLEDLIEVSRLSAMQEICFRLHIAGISCRSMAATLGIGHQAIAIHLRAAKRRVRSAYGEGRYAGWYEVYLSEVNRSRH